MEAKRNFEYDISPLGHLKRANKRLRSNRPESLFYAAQEIRCAIEARAREQLLSLKNVPKKTAKLWHAEKIMEELEKRIEGAKLGLVFNIRQSGHDTPPFVYRPVDKKLLDEYGKLGDLLHAQRSRITRDLFRAKKRWLKEVSDEVAKRCQSNMLKPPKWKIKCSKCKNYLTWEELHAGEKFFISCKCGNKTSLVGKHITMIMIARKTGERTVELLSVEEVEGEV